MDALEQRILDGKVTVIINHTILRMLSVGKDCGLWDQFPGLLVVFTAHTFRVWVQGFLFFHFYHNEIRLQLITRVPNMILSIDSTYLYR